MTLDAVPILAANPTWNGSTSQFPNFSQPGLGVNFKNGNLIDTSCYTAWSLRVAIGAGGGNVTVIPTWYEDLSEVGGLLAFAPPNDSLLTFPGAGNYRVHGTVESPLLSILLSASAPTNIALHFQLSNRPRAWAAPYTPENHGEILAFLLNQSVAVGGNISADLPFYLGPAHFNANIDSAATAQAHIVSDGTTPAEIASLYTSDQTADLWIPPVLSGSTKWSLTAHVNSSAGAPKTIGATVVAA